MDSNGFTMGEFAVAVGRAAEHLRLVQQELQAVTCPPVITCAINLRNLTPESTSELLDEVPSGYAQADREVDYVYVIKLPADRRDLVQTLWAQLESARKLADDYCRINSANANTTTLYVGRSKKLKGRLTQHLGAEQRGIFAMHLQRWATSNDALILISYMRFAKKDGLLVQAIEDGLWMSLKPAFGRKGER